MTAGASDRRMKGVRVTRIALLLIVGVLPIYLVMSRLIETSLPGTLLLLSVLGSFALAYRWEFHRDPWFLTAWLAAAAGLGVVSIASGLYNGLTDEPYVTPALVHLFPNLYGGTVNVSYDQYGSSFSIPNVRDVYLPLLPFLQVPVFDYRWTAFACWLGSVTLLRRTGAALTIWGSPWVALLAANGFNDFLPFLLLTIALAGGRGRGARVAEVVALGVKQLANVVVVAFHLWHRRWFDALFAVGVTVAWLVPFAILSPSGTWCHAVLIQTQACGGGLGPAFGTSALLHINYFVWPLWLLAALGPAYVSALRGPRFTPARARVEAFLRRRGFVPAPSSSLVVLLTPFARNSPAPGAPS